MSTYEIFGLASAIASILSFIFAIVPLMRRHEWRLGAAVALFGVFFLAVSVYLSSQLAKANELTYEAAKVSAALPAIRQLDFKSPGENCGIIARSLTLVEKYKATVISGYEILRSRSEICKQDSPEKDYSTDVAYIRRVRDAAALAIGLVRQLANQTSDI